MSISGNTMSISTFTVGGVNIKTLLAQCKFTFKSPEFGINSAITIDFAGCTIYHRDDTPGYEFVVIDAADKLLFGKLASK